MKKRFLYYLILVILCINNVEAKRINDEEMANVKGAGWSGWICGFCWDACDEIGSEAGCEAQDDCTREYDDAGPSLCGAMFGSNSTPNVVIWWCYSDTPEIPEYPDPHDIYCGAIGGPFKTCMDMEICNCYDPGHSGGFCEVVSLGNYSDQDNCEPV